MIARSMPALSGRARAALARALGTLRNSGDVGAGDRRWPRADVQGGADLSAAEARLWLEAHARETLDEVLWIREGGPGTVVDLALGQRWTPRAEDGWRPVGPTRELLGGADEDLARRLEAAVAPRLALRPDGGGRSHRAGREGA